jgi:hypothetical protein
MKNLLYKSIDTMKWNKDHMNSQQTDTVIQTVINLLVKTFNPTHIAIAAPLNTDAQFRAAGTIPSPRTAETYYQKWCDTIHAAGSKVLHRGTLSEIEGIWGFTKAVGSNRIPAGTASSAATDGTTTLLGRMYQHINRLATSGAIVSGDILAFLPERTEGIFSDSTAFLPNTGAGVQTNFVNFFADLRTIENTILANLSITGVITGYTANNFSELSSGWLPAGIFTTPNIVAFDHYGTADSSATSSTMNNDLRTVYSAKGNLSLFHQEWADHWNGSMPENQRLKYLKGFYDMWQKLANEGKLIGFNYWGGWSSSEGSAESILDSLGGGNYRVNSRGLLLASYFKQLNPSSDAVNGIDRTIQDKNSINAKNADISKKQRYKNEYV